MTITKTDQKNFAQPPMSFRRNTSPKTRIRSQNQITKPKNTTIVPRMLRNGYSAAITMR